MNAGPNVVKKMLHHMDIVIDFSLGVSTVIVTVKYYINSSNRNHTMCVCVCMFVK